MSATGKSTAWEDIFFTARDGLRLYARRYAAPRSHRRPVLCLPGLTRNSRDFHDLAVALSQGAQARAVYTFDYRGRGQSDYDSDWRHYSIPAEMLDVMDLMTLTGLHGAAIVGTSRGGLIAMVLAAAQPTAIGAVVLNDIGPVIERAGLARIAGYVGRIPAPETWKEAGELVASMSRGAFPAIAEGDWEAIARQWFNDRDGRPTASYDPKLLNALSVTGGPIPELWPQFKALARVPVLVVRGSASDILSEATVERMRREHPRCTSLTVEGQGHAPLLKDPPTIAAIAAFLASADERKSAGGHAYRAAATA